jgi:hypothetical protein
MNHLFFDIFGPLQDSEEENIQYLENMRGMRRIDNHKDPMSGQFAQDNATCLTVENGQTGSRSSLSQSLPNLPEKKMKNP